jgi:RND family efflux transporter MFP subunit
MKYFLATLLLCVMVSLMPTSSHAAEEYKVTLQTVSDPKVVFATVESTDVVSARARIGGTIVSLNVKEGDIVQAGQEIAVVGDQKLALQVKTIDAQIAGLVSQSEKANADLKRVQNLIGSGAVATSTLDATKAVSSSANNDLKARRAQRELIEQQMTEGKILSPSYGRVLHVPLTSGSVIMAGETIATIAADSYILRIQLPERHAQFIKKGDKIRIDGSELGNNKAVEGEVSLVYPAIENGRVQADVTVPDLANYFVGERVRVWVSTAQREVYTIPRKFIRTRSGIDYVGLKSQGNKVYEVPVQVGQKSNSDKDDTVEILSGVKANDIIILP